MQSPVDLLEKAVNFEKVRQVRTSKVLDLAERLGTISPDRLFLNGFPARNPVAVFNPSLLLENGLVSLYPRIIVGYYKYVSAIVESLIPLNDILTGHVNLNVYSSNLAITPSNRYDLWGAEDPRAYRIHGYELMTYTGRTIGYFSPDGSDKTLPITAVKRNGSWSKVIVHRASAGLEGKIHNDKNAFILENGGEYYLFHRPQLETGEYIALISKLPAEDVRDALKHGGELREIRPETDWLALPHAAFEEKIAWGPPPIRLRGDDYLFILHGVGVSLQAYRLFAAIIELPPGEPPIIKAVTPTYIMEPREPYETFGDRPYTVFPCGIARHNNEILLSYGAADYMAAFASISYEELMDQLEEGRVE
ncbi:MAG: glycosidase [Desulfurococcales archaeon]|nr:glycosidase [Desulfurococcales archaeon]